MRQHQSRRTSADDRHLRAHLASLPPEAFLKPCLECLVKFLDLWSTIRTLRSGVQVRMVDPEPASELDRHASLLSQEPADAPRAVSHGDTGARPACMHCPRDE